ncbi:unnamed protein product [Echinostoma caproni]|uniref:RNase_PH domain-containing protein n=1 Tax=Echinostoma caproni TaxID=27848 RepID=A0A183BEV3_9TREM|nr:unnamed protein product [Echinostoma caproni]
MAELFYNGRRIDGRRANELRSVFCQFELGNSDGIVLLHQGNTKVMASVVGPHPCRFKGDMKPDEALILCKYSKPPFSSTSGERRKISTRDRSSNDFEIFTCVVRKDKYPMSQIDIFLEVLQSDGSEFACAVNAATLALTDAGIEMKHLVCAVTVVYLKILQFDFILFRLYNRLPQMTQVAYFLKEQDV